MAIISKSSQIYYWPFCLRKEENRLVVERMGSDGLRP